ncbi:multidrug transporter [Spiroplasma poulsonii]|uniref:Multidrug transporter n=1 Tax=Spiroplasma poulsonii TaxID=2138 RepID=A0A3S0SZ32_9MOLU|nr:MATE family efflux transporter [Spiroplasma poulsonii]MBW3058329.1 multidrug transporter [Spiroplasma poulsonii]RUP77563.1 multidrug transporter [Spiroplasma poulsonii]
MSEVLTVREKKLRFEQPWKTIAYFCIPTVFLMVVQGLYNIIDKKLALEFVAPDAIYDWFYIDAYNQITGSAVSIVPLADMRSYINVATQYASQTYNLQWSFSIMIGMGCAMNFSIAYGQRDIPRMRWIAGNGFSTTVLFSIIIAFAIFCIVYPGWNAVFITSQMGKNYNPITKRLCWEYSFPMLAAAPMMFLSYYFMSLLRSEGQMKWVTIMILSSIIINSVAAIFFMKVCHLGMSGAMLGTVFSWTVQVIWGLIIVFKTKNSYSKFYWSDLFHIEGRNVADFSKAGLPNFINNAALVVTSYVATSLVGQLPNQVIHNGVPVLQELYSSIVPWMTLVLSAGIGVTQGARSIIAYNYGAKKNARIWEVLKRVILLIIIWFSLMLIVFILFGKDMMILFAFPPEYAAKYRWWIVLNFMTYPFCSLTYIALTLFQGINRSILATFTSSLRSIVVILPLIGIGYGVSQATGNPIFYYVFIGLNDLISAAIIIPILVYYWKKYHTKLVDEPDPYFNEYQEDLQLKKGLKLSHKKNKN